MKQLKFNHSFAELIRGGKKTATFRMYDDKDLSVNDRVQLLDKVDSSRPATWKPIGVARIDSIVEKRLSAITENDLLECEQYNSLNEVVEVYKQYYGEQVTADTPVKVIRFTVETENSQLDSAGKGGTSYKALILFADGGSRGNPGPSAAGYAILSEANEVLVKRGIYIGVTTNNQAEYAALKLGLEELLKMGAKVVRVYMDSLLVVNQMTGSFKVKNRDLWPIHDEVRGLTGEFDRVTFTHVPRSMNKVADAAVNEALDLAAETQN